MNHLKNVAVVCLLLGWSAGVLLRAEDTIDSLKQKRLDLMSQIVSQLNLEYSEGVCGIQDVIDAEIRLVKLRQKLSDSFQDKGAYLKALLKLEERRAKVLKRDYHAGSTGVSRIQIQRCELKILALKQRALEYADKALEKRDG